MQDDLLSTMRARVMFAVQAHAVESEPIPDLKNDIAAGVESTLLFYSYLVLRNAVDASQPTKELTPVVPEMCPTISPR